MDLYIIYLFLIVMICESIVSALWFDVYYRYGLPVFNQKVDIKKFRTDYANDLERFQDSGATRPFIFRAISSREIAFREKMYGLYWLDYLPVMRGFIHVTKNRRNVLLTGKLNWYILFLPVIMLLMIQSSNDLIFIAIVLALLFAIYLFQRHRFSRIAGLLEKRS